MTQLPPPPEPPSQLEYRETVGWFVTGVTVMTAVDPAGQPHGMTANAVSSLSLEPLLVLVCVATGTAMSQVVVDGGVFALSVLAADQQPLSDHFADDDRGYGVEEFDGVATTAGITGAPLLEGAAAWLDCRVHDVLEGGDHLIVLGEVVLAEQSDVADVLLYTPDGYDRWPSPRQRIEP